MNSRLNTKCLRNFHFFVLFPFNYFFHSEVIEVLRNLTFPDIVTYCALANLKKKTHLSFKKFTQARDNVYTFLCKQPNNKSVNKKKKKKALRHKF